MATWLSALLWGSAAGFASVLGALIGSFAKLPRRLVAAIMSFGAGVLISALSFELMEESYKRGGFDAAAIGFLGGAVVYTTANVALAQFGARHRKPSGGQQPSEQQSPGSGVGIALGALLDGIPESIAIGLSLLHGGGGGLDHGCSLLAYQISLRGSPVRQECAKLAARSVTFWAFGLLLPRLRDYPPLSAPWHSIRRRTTWLAPPSPPQRARSWLCSRIP